MFNLAKSKYFNAANDSQTFLQTCQSGDLNVRMNMEQPSESTRLVNTSDNSVSLFSAKFGESYHSLHGAVTESMIVFIQNGLQPLLAEKEHISIFEMGFGTGLNAVLTHLNSANTTIYYETVEKYPPSTELIRQFAETQWATHTGASRFCLQLHEVDWNQTHNISPHFIFRKLLLDFADYQPPVNRFDLIYFDAFSPEAQQELWTTELFAKLYRSLVPGGVLVTYSSKGIVKNSLREAGFKVERLPGPPGKRHVLRATKYLQQD